MNLWIDRCFVRIVDTREVFDLTGASLFVQAFRVAFFGFSQRAIDEDFDELEPGLFVQLTDFVTIVLVRADKARQ